MKISPILNINAAYAAFSGDGQGGTQQFLQPAFGRLSQPVDSVLLSSTAQAHLRGSDPVDSEFASGQLNTGSGNF